MFKAYIDPFIVTMDIKFISPETMLVESMQFVRYTDGSTTYTLAKDVGEVVRRDKDPLEHVFRLVSGEEEVLVGFGYSDTGDKMTHQFNFIIKDSGSTCYAIRLYDHVFGITDRPHVGSISTAYNKKMDAHNMHMKHNYLADVWE